MNLVLTQLHVFLKSTYFCIYLITFGAQKSFPLMNRNDVTLKMLLLCECMLTMWTCKPDPSMD